MMSILSYLNYIRLKHLRDPERSVSLSNNLLLNKCTNEAADCETRVNEVSTSNSDVLILPFWRG
jgi:hypothetical protein